MSLLGFPAPNVAAVWGMVLKAGNLEDAAQPADNSAVWAVTFPGNSVRFLEVRQGVLSRKYIGLEMELI